MSQSSAVAREGAAQPPVKKKDRTHYLYIAVIVAVFAGIVVGLVAITPAAGFVGPMGAMALGALAALPCYFAILYRSRTRLDDSLDVFAAHGTGGIVGAVLTGVFASAAWGGTDGLLHGNAGLVVKQAVAVLGAGAYSAVMTVALLKAISLVAPLRRGEREEGVGMDVVQHGEEAYSRGEGAVLVPARRIGDVPPTLKTEKRA